MQRKGLYFIEILLITTFSFSAAPVEIKLENVNTTAGTLDIYITNQAGCSYCSDNLYNTRHMCLLYGSDPSSASTVTDATWQFDANIDSTTCVAYDQVTDLGKHGEYFDGRVGGVQFKLNGLNFTSNVTCPHPQGFACTTSTGIGPSGGIVADSVWSVTLNDSLVILVTTDAKYIAPNPTSRLLTSMTFTNFGGTGICFGEDTGSAGSTVVSDAASGYVSTGWGVCDCASGTSDACGECGDNVTCMEDGLTGCTANNQCESDLCDCLGECGGDAVVDNCATCDNNPANNCGQDCAGTWGGSAVNDCSGYCTGTAVDTDGDGICDTCTGVQGSTCAVDQCTGTPSNAPVFVAADSAGCSVDQWGVLSITLTSPYKPDKFSISQNFPNPFNPVTSINFDVAEVDEISLIVYDLTGKEIITLASGVYTPGNYNVEWNALNNEGDNISSGMYIYRYFNSEIAITRKMLYLK